LAAYFRHTQHRAAGNIGRGRELLPVLIKDGGNPQVIPCVYMAMTLKFASWRNFAMICAVGLVAGCSATSTVTVPGPATTVTAAAGSGSAAAAATSPSAKPTGAQNLVASASLKAQLLAAYLAQKAYQPGWVTGPTAGSVYYGFLPSTNTYWAMATFAPAPGAPQQVNVGMQDGGGTGVYTAVSGQPWTVHFAGVPFPCPGALPQPLMAVWNITPPVVCASQSGLSAPR
jgi:hypothetical protein